MGGTVRHSFDEGNRLAKRVMLHLLPTCEVIQIVGSLRRRRPDVGDVDLLVIPKRTEAIVRDALREISGPLTVDGDRICIGVVDGIPVNLFFTSPDSWGAAMLYTTGPRSYNISSRKYAKACDLRLNEKGVLNLQTGAYYEGAGETEVSMCKTLGIPWIAPERRGPDIFHREPPSADEPFARHFENQP